MTVRVNGRRWTGAPPRPATSPIDREWRTGDRVEVTLPMTLRVEPLPGATDVVAFVYGPIVLAGRLGREGLAPGNQIIVNERESGNMLNADVRGPGSRRRRRDAVEADPPGSARPADVSHRWHRTAARRGAGAVLPARARAVQPVLEARAG